MKKNNFSSYNMKLKKKLIGFTGENSNESKQMKSLNEVVLMRKEK